MQIYTFDCLLPSVADGFFFVDDSSSLLRRHCS